MALLAAFQNRGLEIASFKSGPDYIDPMFHKSAIGIFSKNIDLFFEFQILVVEVILITVLVYYLILFTILWPIAETSIYCIFAQGNNFMHPE